MIKQYWEKANGKIDELSLRERVLIFSAVAFLLVSLVNAMLLGPLLAQQKILAGQVVQQQEKMKEIQSQVEALQQIRKRDENSPLRQRLLRIRKELAASNNYIQGLQGRLVPAEKMPDLLEQVLVRSGNLQLVSLRTLPLTPLLEKEAGNNDAGGANAAPAPAVVAEGGGQIFKHGVQITVRGSYLGMLNYLVALEHLPSRMLWGMARMKVIKYPEAELTLTVYTLSLDKVWMPI